MQGPAGRLTSSPAPRRSKGAMMQGEVSLFFFPPPEQAKKRGGSAGSAVRSHTGLYCASLSTPLLMERKADKAELQAQMHKQMHERLEMERRARDAFELKASMQRQIDQLRNERLIEQLQQAEREKRAELQKKVEQLEMKEQRAQMELKLSEERAMRKEMKMEMEMEMEQKLAEERAMRKAGELKAERALIQGQVQQLKEALLQERHDRQLWQKG